MTKQRTLQFLLSTVCGIFLASAAMAATPLKIPEKYQITKPIYVWKSEVENNKQTKAFDNCRVENMYDNGTLLTIAQNAVGIKRLALSFPQQKLKKDQHYDLALQVDRKDVFPVEAVAVSASVLTIDISDSVPDQMRKGQLLHIRGPNDEVIYALDGMEGAVASLHDCVVAQKSAPVRSTEPPAVPNPPVMVADAKPVAKDIVKTTPAKADVKTQEAIKQKAVTAAPAPVAIASKPAPIVKTIEYAASPLLSQPWKDVFAQTSLNPDKLIPMKKSKDQPLDYIWQKDQVFIGVKQKEITSENDLAKTSLDYLRMLKGRCKGNFLAESTTPQEISGKRIIWQASEAACSSTNSDSIAATLFVATPQGTQVYFFESSDKNGAKAISARDQVQAVITQ